jgi:hypothetical protein
MPDFALFPNFADRVKNTSSRRFCSYGLRLAGKVHSGGRRIMTKTFRNWLIVAAAVLIVGVIFLFIAARSFATKLQPELRRQAILYLEKHFNSRVSLDDLQIRTPNVPRINLLLRGGRGTIARVEGRNLSLRYEGHGDLPPLFSVKSFHFDLDLGMLWQSQPHIPYMVLEGMTIFVPPQNDRPSFGKGEGGPNKKVVIEKMDIINARLVVLPKESGRQPLDFALQKIQLAYAGAGQQMKYQAALMNPKPPGQIHSKGMFGPWNTADPGATPMEGDYDFANADLGVFKGIAGILHSSGHFTGTLSAVEAKGEATVPDFRLTSSGNRVPLETQYDVLVDGRNGNTVLHPVHARLRNTEFQTSGGIIKREMGGRRAIDLDVTMPRGHIEDLLLLAVKGKPFMSGIIHMQAKISIPPLGGTVQEKLRLNGTFDIAQGEFQQDEVQDKVDELSRRGQGRPSDESIDNVFSHMGGTFLLDNQVMTFRRLNFSVAGADIGMHGQYGMADDVLDFHGNVKLRARVSQMVTGWKHWLAKPLDPFFAKNGAGTFLQIKVGGSSKKPEFGLDHGQ